MRNFHRMTLPRLICLALVLAVAGSSRGAPAENPTRFTQTLSAVERTQTGVARLDSDQAAVLDALVRRDITARTSTTEDPKAAAQPFSQRLTADERRIAGLALLTKDETARLDALIESRTSASVARALLAPPVYLQRSPTIRPVERDDRGKIHGSFSLSYGWGKGGYSERTGGMELNYDDPAGRYSISVGYTESHVKLPPGQGVYIEGPPYRP